MARRDSGSKLSVRVWDLLGRDGIMLEAMSRAVVNQRALARWLITEHSLDASEDAVLAAIRRGGTPHKRPLSRAYKVLGQCHVNVRTRIAEVIVPRMAEAHARIPRIFSRIDLARGEVFYLSEGEAGIRIAVDESNVGMVLEQFRNMPAKVRGHLAAMIIVWPPKGDVPGPSALISMSLALAGINVWAAVDADPDSAIFVDEKDAQKAFQILDDLFRSHATSG